MFAGQRFFRGVCCQPAPDEASGRSRGATHAMPNLAGCWYNIEALVVVSPCMHISRAVFCVTSCFSGCSRCVWGPRHSSSVTETAVSTSSRTHKPPGATKQQYAFSLPPPLAHQEHSHLTFTTAAWPGPGIRNHARATHNHSHTPGTRSSEI